MTIPPVAAEYTPVGTTEKLGDMDGMVQASLELL